MIANLPLLIVDGHPVALDNVTPIQLEKFITFMVTCSWGHDTVRNIRQPPWWPKEVPFSHPFKRPNPVPKRWASKLRNVVRQCYDYHKSTFLLVFSAQLSRLPRSRLRYVDNRDHTTSLYYKPENKLMVTFRNENMNYDSKTITLDDEDEAPHVKADSDLDRHENEDINEEVDQIDSEDILMKSADIYLCDNCDSHFDNLETLKAHERLCNNEDIPTSTCSGGLQDFLSALKLQPIDAKPEQASMKKEKGDTKSKSVRSTANIDRGPPYPFSSLAYMKNLKPNIDTTYSRERIERYCCTSTLPSKIVANKMKNQQFPVRYRRPIDYWHRKHVFPHQRNKKILDVNGQLLMFKCRPITVHMENMSLESIQEYIDTLKKEKESKAKLMEDKDIVFVEGMDFDHCAETETKHLDPLKRCDSECEVIDLCSDDETSSVNENCDPRAGVTCVMRGGAVLRRTAATPQDLPSEPCGARQRPLATAVLQPHPVILIAHTLNNIQTIALD